MAKKKKNTQHKIAVNAILNTLRSGMAIIFPLITYPYILRILGKENIGKISYGYSIISYLSMLAMLGVSVYGVREGAKTRTRKECFKDFVNEIYTINVISTCLTYMLLFVSLLCLGKLRPYGILLSIQSLSIIFSAIAMDWINTVFEDYFFAAIRCVFLHLISLFLIFFFVKKPDDYMTYILLISITNGVNCILNRIYIRKYVKPVITITPNILLHIKPLMFLFVNDIAVSVYVNFDITMIGWIKGDMEAGIYSVSVRIYTVIKNLFISVYAVIIPRLSHYIGEHNFVAYKKLYSDFVGCLILILVPIGVGLICISDEIILFIGGSEYSSASLSLKILSVSLIFAIFGGLVTAVLNITIGKERINLISTIVSAVVNCGMNFSMIPRYGQYGAAATTLISEAFVFFFCFKHIKNPRKYIDFLIIKDNLKDAIIGGIFIVGITIFVKYFIYSWVWRITLILFFSALVYISILLLRQNTSVSLLYQNFKQKFRGVK